jgi:hypothetical protein
MTHYKFYILNIFPKFLLFQYVWQTRQKTVAASEGVDGHPGVPDIRQGATLNPDLSMRERPHPVQKVSQASQ